MLWTVLSQTDFGLAHWLVRFAAGLRSCRDLRAAAVAARRQNAWIEAAVADSGRGCSPARWPCPATPIGGLGAEGIIHPAADVLHLIAAAAWVGALLPLALLLAAAGEDNASLADRAHGDDCASRSSASISVGTLLVTGIVNTWYLAGSVASADCTPITDGSSSIKIALFLAMVAIAAVNRHPVDAAASCSTPASPRAASALRQLRRNAAIEAFAGAAVIAIVAVLGTMPPAIHAASAPGLRGRSRRRRVRSHPFGEGMADVTIRPGHAGRARATIRLWNDDFEPLEARQ